jgi:glycine/D-amino acid oxidase-like deaminating enzyme
MQTNEMIVVGGGLIGAAIAYGAARAGAPVTLLDQGDVAYRASRSNFGLVWVQGKGDKSPRYARWCRDAVTFWPALAKDLHEVTGVDVALQQAGGFEICFTDADMRARAALMARVVGDVPYEMLDHAALKARLPAIGPKVAGASYCPLDGHVNPLRFLHALHAGLKAHSARVISSVDITQVSYREKSSGFEVASRNGQTWRAPRLVLAAGLGNKDLAPQVGLQAPVSPTRGQVLITERLQPFLPYPANLARQTNEGSVQLGATIEDVGLDDGITIAGIESIAKRAVAAFPVLSNVRLVRAWSGLRVLTPDSLPIYQESTSCPGAFVATTHSGVSLAGVHAQVIGPWMAGLGPAPDDIDEFSGDRFQDRTRSFSNAFLDAFSNGR